MTKQKNNIIPIELTQEEQEFDNILTDKLIEVAYNPSMRKDFIIQASDTEQYRFYKEDIPSEIERKALFLFNLVNGNYERALQWAEQVQDNYAKESLYTTYYAVCAQNAESSNSDVVEFYDKYLEHAVNISDGVSCSMLQNYASCLKETTNVDGLMSLASKIMVIGLHYMDATRDDALQIYQQLYSQEETDLFLNILQLISDCASNEDDEGIKEVLNYYHAYETAYFYACTGRLTKAKEEYKKFCDLIELEDDSEFRNMYDFSNLTDEERSERHEWFRQKSYELLPGLYDDGSTLPVEQAFGFSAPPKQPRPKKGSFDWLYNQGEKSYLAILNNKATDKDYANIRAVAEAYRTGNGVRQNLRLAECWDKMAKL